jgi:phosphocarrier protein HPr
MKTEIRAIVDINQTAANFRSSIVLRTSSNRYVDVKSLLGLSISLVRDHMYKLDIHGPDEAEAAAAMLAVFQKHHLSVEVIEN